MATPTVASSTTQAYTGALATCTLPKPSGLAVGDVMVAQVVQILQGASATWSAPAGWTVLHQLNGFTPAYIYAWKQADAADVAASNFVFTSTRSAVTAGILCRCINVVSGAEIQESSIQEVSHDVVDMQVFSYTTTVTPRASNTLVLALYMLYDLSIPSAPSYSTYTSTPSLTFTELQDIGYRDGASDGGAMSAAYVSTTSPTQFTQYGASSNLLLTQGFNYGVIILLNGDVSATAQISHLDSLATPIGLEGINTATAQISHIDTTPSVLGLESTNSSDRTQWSNTDKPVTTWQNPDK